MTVGRQEGSSVTLPKGTYSRNQCKYSFFNKGFYMKLQIGSFMMAMERSQVLMALGFI